MKRSAFITSLLAMVTAPLLVFSSKKKKPEPVEFRFWFHMDKDRMRDPNGYAHERKLADLEAREWISREILKTCQPVEKNGVISYKFLLTPNE